MLEKLILNAKIAKWKLGNISIVDKTKLYALWEQQQLTRLFREFEIDCVFDVGANYGQYATMLRKKCSYEGLIISFEPIPEAAKHLRYLSSKDPRWIVNEIALSNNTGEIQFNIMAEDQYSSISDPTHEDTSIFKDSNNPINSIKVKTDTLDNMYEYYEGKFKFTRPFLKLDTQGFDVKIIKKSNKYIGEFVGIQSELSVRKIYADSVYFCDAIKYYESIGFTLSAFVPNNAGHFPILVETDCLMINKNFIDA